MQLCLQLVAVSMVGLGIGGLRAAEPIPLIRAEATFHAGTLMNWLMSLVVWKLEAHRPLSEIRCLIFTGTEAFCFGPQKPHE